MKTTLRNLWTAVVVVGLCAACGGSMGTSSGSSSRVSGKVTDKQGTQAQSLSVGSLQTGGSGTIAATASVRVSTVAQNGALTTAAEGKIDASGSYSIDVPNAGSGQLIVQAVDASGKVIAQAALEQASEGQTTTAPPMDEESSLEASVFLQALADQSSSEAVNLIDLRARINSNMAAAAQLGSSSADALQARVKALAEAVRAAQQTEVNMYAKAGVTTQTTLFQAELGASASLNASLDAAAATGADTADAYKKFYADLEAAATKAGASVQQQAESERAAGASFRATVKARLSADAKSLLDASQRASASLEARASEEAVNAILAAGSAEDSVKQQASTTNTTLTSQVSAAASASAAVQAFATFDSSVAMGSSTQGSLLAQYNGGTLTGVQQLALTTAVTASTTAAGTLSAALSAAASAAITTTTDVSLLASKTAEAFQTYSATVNALSTTTLSGFGAKASFSAQLLVVAEGSFQAGQ